MKKLSLLLIISIQFILPVKGVTHSGTLERHSSQIDQEHKEEVRKRVLELADRFIQRWHETLDLKILANEMFVSSLEFKPIIEKLFYVWYIRMAADENDQETSRPKIEKAIDNTAMQECLLAYNNLMMIAFEYRLAFEKPEASEGEPFELPKEIISEWKKLESIRLSDKKIDLISIKKFTTQADKISRLFRKHLPREIFDSARYKAKVGEMEIEAKEDLVDAAKELERDYAAEREDHSNEPFLILHKLKRLGIEISKDLDIYYLKRGHLTFLFVNEQGQLKILSVI